MDINSDSGSGEHCDDPVVEDASHCSDDEESHHGLTEGPEITVENTGTARSSARKTNRSFVRKQATNTVFKNKWIFGKVSGFP